MSVKDLKKYEKQRTALGQATAHAAELHRPKSEFEQRREADLAAEADAKRARSDSRRKRVGVALAGITMLASPIGQKAASYVGDKIAESYRVEQYQPTAEQQAAAARGEAAEEARKNPAPDSYLPPKETWETVTAEQATVPWAVAEDAIPDTANPNDGNMRAELANDLIEQSAQNKSAQIDQGEQFSVPAEIVDQLDPKTIVER